jgi:Pvc16 N-terminal domain
MSNSLAIAAVTKTLLNLITRGVHDMPGQKVTTLSPEKARKTSEDQLNIFLYHAPLNAAWRNMDMPRQIRPGETGQPPLGLNLHYLITGYGKDDDEILGQQWLGKAMSILHDHPVLGAQEIRVALAESGLQDQIERVRITPQSMSADEMSKLWTAFQAPYRISMAYQVDVVLIESTRPAQTPLPVLTRGQDDRGVSATAGDTAPILETVRLPNRQSSALLGDELTVIGQSLGDLSAVRFTLVNSRLAIAPTILLPAAATQPTEKGIKVTLPDDAAAHTTWAAGFYTVAVLVDSVVNGKLQTWSSNELPISLAPRVEKIEPANPVARDGNGNVTLTLTCKPEVKLAMVDPTHMRFDQQVVLLLGTVRQIAPQAPLAPPPLPAQPPQSTDKLTFVFPVSADEVGEYLIRLRVDGVDLPLVDRTVSPPQFDPSQKVTIT